MMPLSCRHYTYKSVMITPIRQALAASVVLGLVACGSSQPIVNEGGVPGGKACQNDFTPERVAAGEDCDPNLNRTMFCPLVPGSEFLRSRTEIIPCDGVDISIHPVVGGGFETEYIAIHPSGGGTPSAVYLGLHYLNASAAFYGNLTRMTELAKARNVLVLLPQAPAGIGLVDVPGLPPIGGNTLSRWPTQPSQPVEAFSQLLDGVVEDGRNRFSARGAPLYVAGLSNGIPMVYFYACGRANQVEAFLAVAGTQNNEAAAICQPSRAVGAVMIHGTADPIVPYGGVGGVLRTIPENFEDFKAFNQCSGDDRTALFNGASGDVQFDWAPNCADGRRVVLASLLGNGHNWPGDDAALLQELGINLGLFGAARNDIDATIQGFDLLRYAAGR
jgi:polyhydroxybutyrate depolymerase